MEVMVVGVTPTQGTLPDFTVFTGGRVGGWGAMLMAQHNCERRHSVGRVGVWLQRQHTETVQGATDTTDGRISEIPQR